MKKMKRSISQDDRKLLIDLEELDDDELRNLP